MSEKSVNSIPSGSQETQNEHERLAALYRVSRSLGGSLDPDEVLNRVIDAFIQLTGAERGLLMLVDEETNELRVRAERNIDQPAAGTDSAQPRLPISYTILEAVRESGRGIVTTNAQTDPRFAGQKSVVLYALRSILCAPLRTRGKTVGVVYIDNRAQTGLFGPKDLELLEALATHAAAAIENARLYARTDWELAKRVAELEQLTGALQAANRAKNSFISLVIHELRTPMTSIKGYSDLMRQGAAGPVNEMQQNFLNIIRSNVDRMAALVSDLADINQIETGRVQLKLLPTAVDRCISDALDNFRGRLEEKNQTLQMEVGPDLPKALADPDRLVEILNNLLSNAWKYTPARGNIQIRAWQAGDTVRIEVQDTGIGISTQDQSRMFQQFFRSEDPVVRGQQGWGLGLSVARQLVELMGGELGFSSTLGEGSTFWVLLPSAKE